jgi:hypothetical protein
MEAHPIVRETRTEEPLPVVGCGDIEKIGTVLQRSMDMDENSRPKHSANEQEVRQPRYLKSAFLYSVFFFAAGLLFAGLLWVRTPRLGSWQTEDLGIGQIRRDLRDTDVLLRLLSVERLLGLQVLCVAIPCLAGLVFGILALVQTYKVKGSAPAQSGRHWLRKAWLAIGLLAFTLTVLFFMNNRFIIRTAYRPSQVALSCRINLKAMGKALLAYESDKGAFPRADNWNDALLDQDPTLRSRSLCCPSVSSRSAKCTYVLNGLVAGKASPQRPVVLLFEGHGEGWNQSGDVSLLLTSPPHGSGYDFLLTDGSVVFCPKDRLSDLVWR